MNNFGFRYENIIEIERENNKVFVNSQRLAILEYNNETYNL